MSVASQWQKDNREKAYKHHKAYRDRNREKLNQKAKEYREQNREQLLARRRARTAERKQADPTFKLMENVRSLIAMTFKGKGKKSYKTEEILGCKLNEFVDYILSKCPEGIGLKDFHRFGYQLDHIIPVSSGKTPEEIVKLNHYSNFQPLFWRDNIQKSNKIQ